MNITFSLKIFDWQLGTFDIRIDLDEIPSIADVPGKPKIMDTVSDYFATRWFARHS